MSDQQSTHLIQRAVMLENRLRKRFKHLRKWARRCDISCYRLYDRDIPEIPISVDLYCPEITTTDATGGARSNQSSPHLYVACYQSERKSFMTDAWSAAMTTAAAAALSTPEAHVHVKQRQRQRGSAQYERIDDSDRRIVVREGGHRFWVNLDDYLDTGLFLDHRQTRAQVQREADGARFLNLFSYTGAFTVYAAMGGARSSVSVDMSNRYSGWAEHNLALNGIDGAVHRIERADVFEYIRSTPGEPFDLVVLDPPTFSNSKKMSGVLDIQRDHARLISDTLRLMRDGGVLYFSTNARRFKLDEHGVSRAGASHINDITNDTVPEDFRVRRPHQCWRIVK